MWQVVGGSPEKVGANDAAASAPNKSQRGVASTPSAARVDPSPRAIPEQSTANDQQTPRPGQQGSFAGEASGPVAGNGPASAGLAPSVPVVQDALPPNSDFGAGNFGPGTHMPQNEMVQTAVGQGMGATSNGGPPFGFTGHPMLQVGFWKRGRERGKLGTAEGERASLVNSERERRVVW